ncbi:sucrase/ferredoxin-like family protein [Tanacetum coccineum]|uniref:Sucrase/ferredoxin-like family protein n=1 Tax=Tanacetum coccineum TaxID=301880 RepID=A0ABQ4ZNM2_9ASTR
MTTPDTQTQQSSSYPKHSRTPSLIPSEPDSASGSFQNDGYLNSFDKDTSSLDEEEEFGFSRSEFRQSVVVGSVKYYERHVFLCYKKPSVWPPRIQAAEFDRLPRLLSAALTARKAHIKRQGFGEVRRDVLEQVLIGAWVLGQGSLGTQKGCNRGRGRVSPLTRLTICEGYDGTETSNGDVLIFPDMIRYRRLTHFDVDTFVEEVLVKDGEWLPGSPEPLKGSYIFVCAHGARDKRCGVCGPALVSRFKDEIELRGYQNKVSFRKVTGHWYGYVMPDDVRTLLEQHVEKGEIVDFLWRGQMGLSEEDQIKAQEQRVIANGGGNIERTHTDGVYSHADGTNVEDTGCCQANSSNSACCRSSKPPSENAANLNLDTKSMAEKRKGNKNPISINGGSKSAPTPHKVCTTPTWLETLESEDVYAALALIGAAVSVAVAYNCYRQLG